MTDLELRQLAKRLGFKSIFADWDHYANENWVKPLLIAEENERDKGSLERRLKEAQIGKFKPMSEFDWDWPEKIDREQIEELFTLDFMNDRSNVFLLSTNGLGKTMIAQNLGSVAISRGYTTRFVKASAMLNHLLECDGATARAKRLKRYSSPDLLLIDEVGYMNYDNRYADLLYEVISSRYQNSSTVVTTNKGFNQWGEIFPNAACVVTMVDRLIHNAEMVVIEGESYRKKEAEERQAVKVAQRKARKSKSKTTGETNK